jgi:hypothetical protein
VQRFGCRFNRPGAPSGDSHGSIGSQVTVVIGLVHLHARHIDCIGCYAVVLDLVHYTKG